MNRALRKTKTAKTSYENPPQEYKKMIFLIVVAYVFSVAVRYFWVYHFSGYEPFMYNGQFMINTNDGYYWAEGARDLLAGGHQAGDGSPIHSAASQLTYLFAKILPFSFETIILYMSTYLSSLVVIPVILIGYGMKRLEVGFIAALLSSIAWSYYNRTMTGYYDTDMLNIVLPAFLLWSLIEALRTRQARYLLFTALITLIYGWWYPQSYSLEVAFFALIGLYTLFFDRKTPYNYQLLAIMLFAMMMTDEIVRLPIIFILYFLFRQKQFDKYALYFLGAGILALFATGGFAPILGELKSYVFRSSVDHVQHGLGLHFFTVGQTIREAGKIPFGLLADRISGDVITFLISLIAYLYLSYKHRPMLLALPMLGLGLIAMHSGLRFTIYAIVPLALGVAFLIAEIARIMPSNMLRYAVLFIGALLVLLPNLLHVKRYLIPTVFNKSEVKVISALQKEANRWAYVVSWWDYGYPLRYYGNVFTLCDGGLHGGGTDYTVSYILTHPQKIGAKLARFDVEYDVKAFHVREQNKTKPSNKQVAFFSNIEEMTVHSGFKNTNNFLQALQKGVVPLPKKTREVYIYLPYRMLSIYPTISLFSNLDIMTGQQYPQHLFFVSPALSEDDNYIYLNGGVALDRHAAGVKFGKTNVPVNHFVKTWYDKADKLQKEVQTFDNDSDINVIYMQTYGRFLIVDNAGYNSLYVQLFILHNYDPKLFKPVALTPYAALYKLKI
jgi:undecaprenyl-diphosphooligosaccharide---protein glycotransferase